MAKDPTKHEVADLIERFVNGSAGDYEWDDFISVPLDDKELDQIRTEAASLPERFPGTATEYCSEAGVNWLKDTVRKLRRR